MSYAELHCHSYFSLLDGASSPEDLVAQAVDLGLAALALTDHDSLAGAVRFWNAARAANLHPIFGAEVTLEDGCHLTLLAETQAGYGNLCQLVTAARLDQVEDANAIDSSADSWAGKVAPALPWARLEKLAGGLIALTGCRRGPVAGPLCVGDLGKAEQALLHLRDLFGPNQLFVELQHHAVPDDDRLVRTLAGLAHRHQVPLVATNNVHYADRTYSMLRDALIAVAKNESLDSARRAGRLPLNSTYALASPTAMQSRFAQLPEALANTLVLAKRCQVSLDFSAYRLPEFRLDTEEDLRKAGIRSAEFPIAAPPTPPFSLLYQLCHDRLPLCYPELRPAVLKQLAHELDIIERAGLAEYFLVVWDIVRFARVQDIRCQGRGSAANSIVAYLLGITNVDPLQHNLLFERFLSSDKFTMPDIDVDFAADRREEVIQYVYRKYGRSHTAMVCNVVTYRARSALRDLGKVLGLPEEIVVRLQGRLDTNSPSEAAVKLGEWLMVDGLGLMVDEDGAPANGVDRLSLVDHLLVLLGQIDGCPRHLSIHSGGILISRAPLDTVVPLESATMPGRIVCQWDKDSVEDAGLIKIDLLALRTLGMVSETLAHVKTMTGSAPDLDRLGLDDPAIYQMLARADTIGAFQVESRAQQQMLPRLKPACFEDIAVEVAIVRPGPIQGGAVHPYLRRRTGVEPVSYLHPSLEPVLAETLGVLLFQEQAIRVAVAAAGFSPGEADLLRRALSRNRSQAAMASLRERFLRGAAEQGIDAETAAAIFVQLAGFAGYGFCKSHAASFALIAYQTLWLKRYHAPAFYCALLNQQPMGFYPPEVIVGDARRHGVETLPPDVNRSDWRYCLEQLDNHRWALRTGLHTVAGLGEQAWTRIEAARTTHKFSGLEEFCVRTRFDQDVVRNLIRAGACDAWGDRRRLLWRLGELDYRWDALELTAAPSTVELPTLDAEEETAWEYELMGLSPTRQMMAHYRGGLRAAGVFSTWQVKQAAAGERVQVAGFVVVRQRPSTAKGILFMSLEDESGLLDLVVKPNTYTRLREVIRGHPLLLTTGIVQRNGRSASLLVHAAEPFAGALP